MFKKNFFTLLLILIFSCGSIVFSADRPKEYKPNKRCLEWYQKGCAYEEIGAVEPALEAFKKAVEFDPNYNFALFRLASLYDLKGDYKSSKPIYEQILKNNVNFYLAYNNMAVIDYSEGNTQKAIERWTLSLRYNPNQSEVYNNLGIVYMARQDYEKALQYFNSALQLKSSFIGAASNRALALCNLTLYKEAIAQYEKNIKHFSYEPLVYYNYASFCTSYHNYARAKQLLTTVIKMRNDSAAFYSALALAQINAGDPEDALNNLEKADALSSQHPDVDRDAGIVYLKKGDLQNALLRSNKAINKKENDPLTAANLGRVYIALKSPDKALGLWQSFITSFGNNPVVLNARAEYYIETGNYTAAQNDLNSVLFSAPHEFTALYLTGKLNQALNNDNKAIEYYLRATEACPYLAESANNAALIYSAKGDNRKASEILSKSIGVKPDFPESYANLGLIYSKMGNEAMAVTTWMQGLTIDGRYAPIYYHLGIASEKLDQKEEALRYYQTYLRMDPEGKYANDVRKRISSLFI